MVGPFYRSLKVRKEADLTSSERKSICPYVCVCVCVSVCLCVCSLFEVPFKHIFAPTSQTLMSKILRDSESLGKSNWKKRSQIWKLIKGVNLLRKEKFVFLVNFARIRRLYNRDQEVIFYDAIIEPLQKTFA